MQARDFLRFLFDWQRVTPNHPHAGPGLGARPSSRSWKVSMLRRVRGKQKYCRRASPSTSPRGWMSNVSPVASSGRASATRSGDFGTRCRASAFDADRAAASTQCEAVVAVLEPASNARSSRTKHARSPNTSMTTARRSTTRSSITSACRRAGGRRRWVSWSPSGLVNSGQLWRPARSADAGRSTPHAAPAIVADARRIAIFGMQDAGRWALVKKKETKLDDARPAATAQRRSRRAHLSHAAETLGRGVLEIAGARSRLVAAVARSGDVPAPPGSTRVRFAAVALLRASPANSSRCPKQLVSCAKCAGVKAACSWSRCPPPIR